jgi:transposase
MPGAVVCEVARRHDVAQSLLFTWRRRARVEEPGGRDGSILLPVEIGSIAAPSGSDAARQSRAATRGRRAKSGMIEIELGSGSRVRVDSEVNADALRRVLSVLSER